jgi:hypothetical protein
MFPFSKVGPFDHTERKALLMAFLACAVFIAFVTVSSVDPLESFRFVPENFRGVDFKNFSYGVYLTADDKPVSLNLTDGKMWDASGWFNLQDVYYKDITGDGRLEAIVRLLHLRCNGSCDGGADMFYIYTMRNGKLKSLWQYETGS